MITVRHIPANEIIRLFSIFQNYKNKNTRLLSNMAAAERMFVDYLAKIDPEMICEAMSLNADLDIFCKSKHVEITRALSEEVISGLHASRYFTEEVESLNKQFKHSAFKSYLTSYLLKDIDKAPLPLSKSLNNKLNYACELGNYHALATRCQIYRKMLSDPALSADKSRLFINHLLSDVDILKNLYGVLGYVEAVRAHSFLAHYFIKEEDEIMASLHRDQTIQSFFSIENLLTAADTKDDSYRLLSMLGGLQAFTIVTEQGELKTLPEIKHYLLEIISLETQIRLQKLGVDEVASLKKPPVNAKSKLEKSTVKNRS